METMAEAVLALIAAGALLGCLWLIFGRLLTRVGSPGDEVCAVVRAEGGAEGLEQTVNALLWLQSALRGGLPILIADDGLTGDGLALAQALVRRHDGVRLCPAQQLWDEIHRREVDKHGADDPTDNCIGNGGADSLSQ